MDPTPRHTVAAVITDGVSPFELGVAAEVFGIDRSYLVDPWYEWRLCATGPSPVRSKVGFTVDTPHGLDEVARADTVVIPMWPEPMLLRRPADDVIEAVQEAHRRGARLLSFCSGAFLLAHAGILDGRRATTHWMFADDLARGFPRVEVDPDVLYVDDGDVMTSAGTAAGIDLCLHVVRLDHGAEVANALARRMVVPPHRDGGQAQYVRAPVPATTDQDPLGDVLTWAVTHLDQPHSVESLARRAVTSPRTFARRFRESTGTTPHRWLLRQRILHAQHLLETTDAPVEQIAERCGFGSAASLRDHFARQLATSPSAYRRTFATSSS